MATPSLALKEDFNYELSLLFPCLPNTKEGTRRPRADACGDLECYDERFSNPILRELEVNLELNDELIEFTEDEMDVCNSSFDSCLHPCHSSAAATYMYRPKPVRRQQLPVIATTPQLVLKAQTKGSKIISKSTSFLPAIASLATISTASTLSNSNANLNGNINLGHSSLLNPQQSPFKSVFWQCIPGEKNRPSRR